MTYIYCFQIFDHRVITFDDTKMDSCPPFPVQVNGRAQTFIAAYWIPTAISQGNGKIFYRMVDLTNKTAKKNTTEIQKLIDEINTARSKLPNEPNITIAECQSAIYITWFNMKTFPSSMNVSILMQF